MGLIGMALATMVGGIGGVYVAQNYDVPNIEKTIDSGLAMVKQLDGAYRKPKNATPSVDDNNTSTGTSTTSH